MDDELQERNRNSPPLAASIELLSSQIEGEARAPVSP